MRIRSEVLVIAVFLLCGQPLNADEQKAVRDVGQSDADTQRGMLGFQFHYQDEASDPTYAEPWLYVHHIVAGGAAERAGLRAGDVIVKINDEKFRFESGSEIMEFFAHFRVNEKVTLLVRRMSEEKTIEIIPDPMPKETLEALEKIYSEQKERERLEAASIEKE